MASEPISTPTGASSTQERILAERYRLLEPLGKGGMGTVYKAEHIRLHSTVAIKEIRGLTRGTGDAERLQEELKKCEHEAHFLVKLNHPNLPKVTDAFIENDAFYLVMEYIQGVTLDTKLQESEGRPLDVLQTVEWGLQIVEVLTYLHAQNPPIIFRDLKPSNVMVNRHGMVKLIDFGIARHFQPGASKDTSLLGSVGYSPPEQFGKGQTDPRSDVYAFGATLHSLLTGRDPSLSPFKFPAVNAMNAQVPAPLSHLIDMCLALEPADRPQSANVVAIQLLAIRDDLVYQRGRGIAPYPASMPSGSPLIVGSGSSGSIGSKSGSVGDTGRSGRSEEMPALAGLATGRQPSLRVSPNQADVDLPDPAWKAWGIAALLVLLIGGGIAVALTKNRQAPPDSGQVTIVTPALPVQTVAPGTSKDTPSKPNDPTAPTNGNGNPSADPTTPPANGIVTNDVRLQTALLSVTNEMLPIVVSGTIRGMAGKELLLSVYFFDGKGNPLPCSDLSLPYFNDQKYLCSYARLSVDSDSYNVSQTLGVPIQLLSKLGKPQPYTYQAMLFGDGRQAPLYKSEMVPLPDNLIDGSSSATTTDNGIPSRPSGALLRRGG